jgi:hypothetical protein
VSKGSLYAHVHIGTTQNKWQVAATQVSIKGWMDEQNVVYIHNSILLSLQEEGNSNTLYHMNDPWQYYAKCNKSVRKINTGPGMAEHTYNPSYVEGRDSRIIRGWPEQNWDPTWKIH